MYTENRIATIEHYGARSATIISRALGALKLAREARDENVPAKRADSLLSKMHLFENKMKEQINQSIFHR